MNTQDNTQGVTVSPQLDELSSTLMGDALDMLAEGETVGVLVAMQDARDKVECATFADDGPDALLEGARSYVRSHRSAVRYAIAYEGAVGLEDGTYADALLLEFGERGRPSFSAYSLFEGRGERDSFRWTNPAPAGEEEPLLG